MKKLFTLLFLVFICFGSIFAQVNNNESFDGTTFAPSGWTNTAIVGTTTWNRVTTTTYPSGISPHTGAGMAQFDAWNASASGDAAVLITPAYSLTNRGANTPTVSYWIYRHSYSTQSPSSALDVYINTSASLTGATLLGTVYSRYDQAPVVAAAGWYQYGYNIPAGFSSGSNYIIFKATGDYYNNIHIDDVLYVSYPSGPLPPSTFSATAVSGSQIDLSFTPNASSNNVVIVYNTTGTFGTPSGTPPSVGTAFAGGTLIYNGTTSPVNHTSLTGSTKYYYAAWSYTAGNYTSTPSTANATTAYGLPFTEGFENITAANQFPPGWSYTTDARSYLAAPGGSWNQIPHTGSKFAAFYYSPAGTGYIMTPGIYLSAGTVYEFGYWYITDAYSGWNSLQVYYGTTSTFSSMTPITNSLISNPVNTTYQQSFSSVTPSASGIYYFAIACNHTTVPYYLSIDDITVSAAGNMNLVSATTSQNTSSVTPKAYKQQIIGVKVVTNNAGNPLKITELDFNSNGTTNTSEIKNARVYYTGNSTILDTSARFGGNITAPGSSTFVLTGNQILARGDNYFWLVYDIAPCATVGNVVDAECTLIKYDSITTIKSKIPVITAPTGSRQIQTNVSESFEGTTFPPSDWTAIPLSGTVNWARVTSGTYPTNPPYSGTAMVQYNAYAASTGNQARMVSAPMDWSGAGSTTPTVAFMMYRHSYYAKTPSSIVDVYVNSSPTHTGATLLGSVSARFDQTPIVSAVGWYQYSYNIPAAYRGASNYIIFVVTSDLWNNVQIDNIQISSFPGIPVANFSTTDTTCIGTPFSTFNASTGANYYSWFYNGVFKTHTTNFGIIPNNLGYDTITLIAESSFCSDTTTKLVYIKNPSNAPVTDFIADKNLIEEGESVTFTDLTAFCPTDWMWHIMPDTVLDPILGRTPAYEYMSGTTMYSQNPIVVFYYGGTYTVSVTTENSIAPGTTKTKQNYIIVKTSATMCLGNNFSKLAYGNIYDDGGPTGFYSFNRNCAYLIDLCASKTTLTFTDFELLSGDSLRIYDGNSNKGKKLWNTTLYPNGLTGNITDANFIKSYVANTGKIYIEFKTDGVTQGKGFIANWTSIPGTAPRPTASFVCDDTVCVDLPFVLTNTSQGADLSYQWDNNNDGIPDDFTKDLALIFPASGSYPIQLVVNDCGGYDTFTKTVVAINPTSLPAMDFTASNLHPRKLKDAVTFTDHSKNCPFKKTWIFTPNTVTFLNSTNSNSFVPVVKFQDTGYYSVELIDSNIIGNNNLVKTAYIHVINYCIPSIGSRLPDIGISRVVLNNIDNSSSCGVNAYTDYSGTLPAVKLEAGATYNITLERITYSNAMTRKVWIDYNKNGDFSDAGELVANEAPANTQKWIGTFKVPATITDGYTLLRIGTSYDNQSNTSCGPNFYGEYEDYRVEFSQDFTIPIITLLGKDTVIMDQCSNYIDSGATATDNVAGNITSSIVVTNDLNTSLAGTYSYRYNVSDLSGNKAVEVRRTIIVQQDTKGPVLILKGNPIDTIMVFESYNDPGYITNTLCIPFSYVKLIGKVDSSKVGSYLLTYVAYDIVGNTSVKNRLVYVIDTSAPVISLIGPKSFVIGVNNSFIDPGSLITDNYYTNLKVIVSGFVNTSVLGSYVLTYNAVDGSGNAAIPVTRIIDVVDTLPPVITTYSYDNGDTIILEVFDKFSLPYSTQNDNYYNNLSTSVSGSFYTNFPNGVAITLGNYQVVFTVTDGSNNSDSVTYIVKVVDTQKPVITLVGLPFEYLCRYDKLVNDSVTVTDNYYKNLTVVKSGTYYTDYVINANPGNYYISYNVKDGSENVADQVFRSVTVEECLTKSIADNALTNYVKVYPNPSDGEFNIKFDLPSGEDITISVMNSLGETIKVIKGNNVISNNYIVELTTQSDGMYYVKIQTEKHNAVFPVILTR